MQIPNWPRATASNPFPPLLYFAGGEVRHQSVGVASKKAIIAKLDTLAVAA